MTLMIRKGYKKAAGPPALVRDVVADRPVQHQIAGFDHVDERTA